MAKLCGVDGCPGGWLCIFTDTDTNHFEFRLFYDARDLLAAFHDVDVMAVDMPIGLSSHGRRRCDEEARTLLQHRHVCIFNAPIRQALYAPSRPAASAISENVVNRRVGSTEWSLYPKIINLDRELTPLYQRWCFEVHPELSFYEWNQQAPMQNDKKSDLGIAEREGLIDEFWPEIREQIISNVSGENIPNNIVARDDINDAFAALWTALRIYNGNAVRIPERPDIDVRGLRTEIWR